MPRERLIYSDLFPYHVTNRSNNKEWFYVPIETTWEIFCEVLCEALNKYHVQLHVLVLMSNHFHMLLSTPLGNLDAFMRYLQTEVCRRIQQKAARINHVFGSRYKWTVLYDPFSVMCVFKYVLRNPVRAGIVPGVEDYAFSTLRTSLALSNDVPLTDRIDSLFSMVPRLTVPRLDWLNEPTPKEIEELITKGLRRFEFKLSSGNDVRKLVEQLKATYPPCVIPDTFSAEK